MVVRVPVISDRGVRARNLAVKRTQTESQTVKSKADAIILRTCRGSDPELVVCIGCDLDGRNSLQIELSGAAIVPLPCCRHVIVADAELVLVKGFGFQVKWKPLGCLAMSVCL